eukprot:179354-Hanusia_phi.AAC.2
MCTIGFPPPADNEMGYPRDAQQVEERERKGAGSEGEERESKTQKIIGMGGEGAVSYTHLRAHETVLDL